MNSRGMSLVMIEYVPRGWLWVTPIESTIGYIPLREVAFLNIVLGSQVD